MYYQVEPLFPGLTRIWDVARTAMYLVEGKDKAVLIDTGVGVGDLKSVVDGLTDKPLTVLITHGHVDHAMGAGAFSDTDIYVCPLDERVYAQHSQMGVRRGYVAGATLQGGDPDVLNRLTDEDFVPAQEFSKFLPLAAGDSFDLGGVTVKVLKGAGHTQGSLTMLMPEWRVLLLGDACNHFTYLFSEWSSSVTQYREMLLHLKKETDGLYNRVLLSHGKGEGTADLIESVLAVCDDILAGTVDNMLFQGSMGEPAVIAKAMDFQRFCRIDGGEGNIVYNPEKLS